MPKNIKILHVLPSGTRQYNLHGWIAHKDDLCIGHIHMSIESNNSTRINKQNNYNINKIDYNRTFNFNNKINKGNGSTRPNKTTTTKRSKR